MNSYNIPSVYKKTIFPKKKKDKHEPYWYLRYVLDRLVNAKSESDYDGLLP